MKHPDLVGCPRVGFRAGAWVCCCVAPGMIEPEFVRWEKQMLRHPSGRGRRPRLRPRLVVDERSAEIDRDLRELEASQDA